MSSFVAGNQWEALSRPEPERMEVASSISSSSVAAGLQWRDLVQQEEIDNVAESMFTTATVSSVKTDGLQPRGSEAYLSKLVGRNKRKRRYVPYQDKDEKSNTTPGSKPKSMSNTTPGSKPKSSTTPGPKPKSMSNTTPGSKPKLNTTPGPKLKSTCVSSLSSEQVQLQKNWHNNFGKPKRGDSMKNVQLQKNWQNKFGKAKGEDSMKNSIMNRLNASTYAKKPCVWNLENKDFPVPTKSIVPVGEENYPKRETVDYADLFDDSCLSGVLNDSLY